MEVCFPYSPYPDQIKYISGVIGALDRRENALLESPTGTGKTLCLLTSCLAWLARQRSRQAAEAKKPVPGEEAGAGQPFVRIVYTSRTHSQLKQVLKELGKTCYRPRVALIASRDQLCINESLESHGGRLKNIKCKEVVLKNLCRYYQNRDSVAKLRDSLLEKRQIVDLEDLMRLGEKHCACPYYTSKSMAKKADLLLMPYNYLTDDSIRENYEDILKNAIIIFDEAHNIEKAAEEGASVALSVADLQNVLSDLDQLKAGLRRDGMVKTEKQRQRQFRTVSHLLEHTLAIKQHFELRKSEYLRRQAADPSASRFVDEVKDFKESAEILFCRKLEDIQALDPVMQNYTTDLNKEKFELGTHTFRTFFDMLKQTDTEVEARDHFHISSGGINIHKFFNFLKVFIMVYDDMCKKKSKSEWGATITNHFVLNFSMAPSADKSSLC